MVEYALIAVALAAASIMVLSAAGDLVRAGFKSAACDETNNMRCCGTAPEVPDCTDPTP